MRKNDAQEVQASKVQRKSFPKFRGVHGGFLRQAADMASHEGRIRSFLATPKKTRFRESSLYRGPSIHALYTSSCEHRRFDQLAQADTAKPLRLSLGKNAATFTLSSGDLKADLHEVIDHLLHEAGR
jgi:hypothetical protein